MRTTINIDDDLFELVRSTAHHNKTALGTTIQSLIERGLRRDCSPDNGELDAVDELTGFPLFSSKRPITDRDIRSLEDET
jgi:hypothetical protein